MLFLQGKNPPLTAAEKQRRYRARRDADPGRRQKYLQKEHDKYRSDIESGKKKRIYNVSEREKRRRRRKWRETYHRLKARKEAQELIITPPDTPQVSPVDPADPQPRISRQQNEGRRRSRKKIKKLKEQIQELQMLLKKQVRKTEKYKKQTQRMKKNNPSPRKKVKKQMRQLPREAIQKTLLFHEALVQDIRNKYTKAQGEKERQIIAKIVTGKVLKKYRLQRFALNSLGFSKKRWNHEKEGRFNFTYDRKRNNRIAAGLIERVRDFYLRDDVSRITTGKKQTITQKKNRKQKRFLSDTMKNLHRKFLAEDKSSISYSLFCLLRPFWVSHPTLSDRDTCMCKMHENLGFLVQKLHQLKVINTVNLDDLVKAITCDTHSIECMYGQCAECKDLSCPVSSQYNPQSQVSYLQWAIVDKEHKNDPNGKTSKITIKKELLGTQEELLEQMNLLLHRFKRHMFNINNQFSHYRALRHGLKAHECLIHVDFSENYLCKYSTEIQAVHFGASHQQATLHTGVLYMHAMPQPMSFCTVSPSRQKGPPAIWQYLSPVLDYLQSAHPEVSTIHFYSDGPCTQYKQRGNFFLFCTELFRRGFAAGTWNFFEASHGKGAPDGVGGALKRRADSLVSKGTDIPDAAELFSALQKTDTTIKLFFVKEEAVEKAVSMMPNNVPPIPSTMRMHQAVTLTHGKLMYRDVSCLCSETQNLKCECFNTKHFVFNQQAAPGTLTDTEVLWQNPDVVGKWCVLKYEGDLYPGIIMDTSETHIQVRCMQKIGVNRFFWPAREDIMWYLFEDIVSLIPPTKPVTGRHMEIEKEVWAKLQKFS
ncbi:uncharacterized protein LOC114441699 isoform X2 [Parambassis ranga]|uniref:Uncharacterized protein LOC114429360 isoform X1 n=1 Tax=Parambassis ranga TaxID=210632 RepID=A0A6P7HR52_9TELE|nr:uncharacterized protein LOC114429360 isoform X1 [Parambassis ranga]XP_028254034.1 uncharacterized protein LOC114429360 isoform X1 [Parambassis ranga]XP_028254035.1 uncharacterized protein LOC114429360 isoform X1 [Parambassis ranga]XP_028254112.1 uncharacterized protein LOC114429579 isoform X1 [Parambassis ranga]XP_028254113.1 uncharacterized protein LOC114429579 isoform X1 [Parambassis ranga]XP_028254114.1 uncharacterized protein LOC114429579 isoform X1 [Parambassis ranga]XP_028254460.1 un